MEIKYTYEELEKIINNYYNNLTEEEQDYNFANGVYLIEEHILTEMNPNNRVIIDYHNHTYNIY